MSAERPTPGGGARLLHADLDGVLSASRNFSVLASRLPTLQTRAIGTLRRRLPVQARRDIQAEYQVGARRLTQDLQARPTEDGLRLVGRFRGIGLRNFGARQTRRGVTAAVLRGKRSLREHAFLGVGVNRNAQVFRREGPKREMQQGRYAGKRRQPLVAAGTVAGDTLALAASAAVNLAILTGASVEETTQKIIALAKAPSAQLIELNQQYRFLSVEVYQHVRALEAQGRAQDAARLAIETFARVHEQRVQEAYARAGSLERAWIALGRVIGGVWQTIKNIGRDDLAFRLSKTTDELNRIGNEWRELGGLNSLDAVLASADVDASTKDRIRALRQERATLQREANAEQATADAQAATQAKQTNAINALGRAQAALGQDRAVAKAQQLRALERDIAALRAGGVKTVEGIGIDAFEKTRRAQIDEQFKAPKGPRAATPKATDADRAREAAERELESLRREVALLAEVEAGQTRAGDAARIRYETAQGALKTLAPALKAQLINDAEALDKARAAAEAERERKAEIEKTTRAYETLRDSLRTPVEVALEDASEQVQLLNDALRDGIATKDAFDAAMARVAQTSFRKPDAVPGAAPELGDTGNDLAQIEQSRVRLQAWHAEQLALVTQFRSQRADLNAQWDAQEETIERHIKLRSRRCSRRRRRCCSRARPRPSASSPTSPSPSVASRARPIARCSRYRRRSRSRRRRWRSPTTLPKRANTVSRRIFPSLPVQSRRARPSPA